MRVHLQTQRGECAAACLAMVASAHGVHIDMDEVRQRFGGFGRGANLHDVVGLAASMGLMARPVRGEPEELAGARLPCILHWDLDHFVVLKGISRLRRRVHIVDPACGERSISWRELSRHFTGVAIECTVSESITPTKPPPTLPLSHLIGPISGFRRSMAKVLVAALVLELFAIAGPLFNQLMVDEAIAGGDADLVKVLVLGFGILLGLQTLLSIVRAWLLVSLTQRFSDQWLSHLFSHLLRLPVAFFGSRHVGDIASRFGSARALQKALTVRTLEGLIDGAMAVVMLTMMALYSLPMTAFVLTACLLYGLIRTVAHRSDRRAHSERVLLAAQEHSCFMETLRSMVSIKSTGAEWQRHMRWSSLMTDVHQRDATTAHLVSAHAAAHGFVFGFERLVTFGWAATEIVIQATGASMARRLTVGMLMAFLAYRSQFTARVVRLIDGVASLRLMRLHAERLADIALQTPEERCPDRDLSYLTPTLEFRDVGYRPTGSGPWLLRHINFTLATGDRWVITGPSGAGKSTLLKIAAGLIAPTEGQVLFGGYPVHHLGWHNVRRLMGSVLQEDVLMSGTLLDNIAAFNSAPDEALALHCAEQVGLADEIVAMPMGLYSPIAEAGSNLSAGQRQRVLLARALYRRPRLLLLDEATSHVDVAQEAAIATALEQLPAGQLTVAHRPETIRRGHRVFELAQGQFREISPQTSARPMRIFCTSDVPS